MAQIIKTNTGYMVRVTWRDENGKQHKKNRKPDSKLKRLHEKLALKWNSLNTTACFRPKIQRSSITTSSGIKPIKNHDQATQQNDFMTTALL